MESNENMQVVQPKVVPAIYQALVNVGADLGKAGISKDRHNEQQHFRFRGIDDVMNAVNPILAKHKVMLQIHYADQPDIERVTAKGSTLIHSRVMGTFTFICATDGSYVSHTFPGTGMDSADKALNKAMSAALKYVLLQTFLIPTEAVADDADATTPDASVPKPPAGFEEWFVAILEVSKDGFDPLREAWKDSPEEFRTYAMTYRKATWDDAKARATAITNQRSAEESEPGPEEPAPAPAPARRRARA